MKKPLAIILCIIMLFAGWMMFFKPHKYWKLQHGFSVDGGKPTDTYIMTTKMRGAFLMAAGTLLLAFLLIGG